MSRGVLLFASNNGSIDYVKQAYFLALRISKYLNLPTSVVTDTAIPSEYVDAFDKIIAVESSEAVYTNKRYYDGSLSKKTLAFNNGNRANAYKLTPYNETIVMDTDFIISNDALNCCFDQQKDFLIYKDAVHIGTLGNPFEFERISDTGIDFYWATVFFFRKTKTNEIFFNLLNHIKENYWHYRSVYQFTTPVFRNDIAFSIAIHIMNGYQYDHFAGKLPGKHYYCIDRDILHKIDNDNFTVLVENPERLGEYLLVNLKGSNLHVMNKFSLERAIDNQ